MKFKTTLISFQLHKTPARYLLIVFKYPMISWNITQTFSKFSILCEKPRFLYLILLLILLVSQGYSHAIIRYICKNFVWEEQWWKQCYIVRIAPWSMSSAIIFVHIEPDMYMAKNRKGFKRFFSILTVMDKVVNIGTKSDLSRFDVIYLKSWSIQYV